MSNTSSNVFLLPDLGEGLPDAEIREWHVKVGDTVKVDQLLVSMETAKAVVDVPSPQAGVIAKLYGVEGDIIITDKPLVEFEGDDVVADQGTVVGHIESSGETLKENFIIGAAKSDTSDAVNASRVRATPAVKNLARKLGVDLALVTATGSNGVITASDVELFSKKLSQQDNAQISLGSVGANNIRPGTMEPLRGVRRAMLQSMTQAHQEVVAVSIFDEADIHAWVPGTDITVRLIQALVKACQIEPSLNAWYHADKTARELHESVNIGLAMDTPEGLFVPVIHHAETLSKDALRTRIDALKVSVSARNVPQEDLKGTTITLSNFGKFAGLFASPIIVPPTVAILGVGRLHEAVVAHEGQALVHKMLPLSLSFDHRAITGGEATRFLKAVMDALKEA